MPIMNGLELLKQISDQYVDIEFILISAYEEFEYAREALNFGARRYILKPINQEKINKLINDIRSAGREIQKQLHQYRNNILENTSAEILRHALNTMDMKCIRSCLKESIDKLESGQDIKQYCFSAISFLFSYYQSQGLWPDKIYPEGKHIFSKLLPCKNKKDIIHLTLMSVEKFFMAMNKKSKEHIPQLINIIKNFLMDHYSDPELSLRVIAGKFGISATYLSTLFKNVTGRNLSAFLMDLRMKRACDLLGETNLKLLDICLHIGYRNPHYFGKVFKRTMHMSPAEYRTLRMIGHQK